ncbi:peptidylprolyl isomerase [Acinetobacter sp. ANC 4558]|uniref:FKBP-type peptidyl-prolyl cis-trans isomerase n=1 Tax=Acinetobacter sp. ANC 4558 TaxID=1977876 RepID=UPI000A32D2E5|nr:FKBP-type peptidyl-prolyl cis-trans isomerase [Acinetobacter sp. ANC 4558]OTG88244.1 peptidylprolyl isomerase [Acinetobacter sp. ANC 4558]
MKLPLSILCLALCSTSLSAKTITNKSSFEDQVSYSFGYIMGRNYSENLKNINLDAFIEGLKIASSGKTSTISEEEMSKVLTQFKQQTEAKQLVIHQQLAETNAKAGSQFLTENKKKLGIHVTPSGLQYQVLQQGVGKTPTASSNVKVNYEGRLLDGTVFDSSIARQQPAEFQVSQVIQGWTEGLQLMKEGAKYRLFIPSNLAYGEIGAGDAIEPNSTLIFDVELLEIK